MKNKSGHFSIKKIIVTNFNENDKNAENKTMVIQLKKFLAVLYNLRGYFYNGIEEYDDALNDFNIALEYQPNYFIAFVNRAYSLKNMYQTEKALEEYTKLIEFAPDYSEFYIDRGDLYADLKNFDEAITDYNMAIQLGTSNPLVYHNRSILRYEMGFGILSLSDASQAKLLDPKEHFDTFQQIVAKVKETSSDSLFLV